MKVLKRDGKLDVYNFEKIKRAVESAYNSVNATMDEKFLQQLSDHFKKLIDKRKDPEEPINIEEIQDEIEKFLVMKTQGNEVQVDEGHRKQVTGKEYLKPERQC